ncbi:restriction endonuclease subunit S [Puniceibacterium sp. IMCC21224]|uniref:restriction endonuclease subunit S n=1 Tax=Puniceibacterium sp. IMCC21224 TaxID=1618204 RepID=UPI00065CEFFF|nr:restriction endonuclease subunit S [Puniceibacterium sp. IMCC21224]KMK67573.1 restriction endonuclease S subunit [Puniceibacterium sp. IMCC21224]
MMTNTTPLGELVNVQTGKLDANASSADGAYPFFTCAREPLRIAEWKYDLDAILIAGNGDLNVKHHVGRFDAYQRTYILDVKKTDVLDSRFLFHFMDKYVERLREQSIGGIIKYIKLGMLTEAQIPLPPLEEQKRIAGILDQADALRRLRTRALDKLGTLGQAIFHEMFGDGVQTAKLTDLVLKITDGTHQAPEWADEGVPFIFVSNVRGQTISLETNKYVTDNEYHRLIKRTSLAADDVIYTCVGSYGNAAVVGKKNRFVFQRHIAHIKPNPDKLDSVYLSYGLEAPTMRAQADRTATGIAQKTVTLTALKKFDFPAPPMTRQREFRSRVDSIERMRASAQTAVGRQQALFASLQHRAFLGEL